MEITKTLANTFHFIFLAKMRGFFRRSLYHYAIAVSLITFALHGSDTTLELGDKMARGLLYFVGLCVGVLVLLIVASAIQSRRAHPLKITFTENDVIVDQQGNSAHRSWGWIITAEESSTMITLLVQKFPRFEFYLPKAKLNEIENRALRAWLVSHGKLPPTDAA